MRSNRKLSPPGIEINLDSISAPNPDQYLDPETIRNELRELEAQQNEYQETLKASIDAEKLRTEKLNLENELETLIRELGDYQNFRESAKHEDDWKTELEELKKVEVENDKLQTEYNRERVEIVRGTERIKEDLSNIEKQIRQLSETIAEIRRPPDEWPLIPVENLPHDLGDLVSHYKRKYNEQSNQAENVAEILTRIEARTYSRYVGKDEQETVEKLREQLQSIPAKENAVQELWTSIAVGIKKSISNVAHDLDTLKALTQSLNSKINSVEISNLSSLHIKVKERPEWTRHIRGIGIDEDMPLFSDAKAVTQSFDDLGRLLSEHPHIKLDELFDLHFEIATSDNKTRTYTHLNAIESNGTTITIKVLINLVLLQGLLGNAKVRIPFYLDECSSLDRDNLAAIVNSAYKMGFTAVLASPDAMDAAERLYFIEEQNTGRVILDPAKTLVHIHRKDET